MSLLSQLHLRTPLVASGAVIAIMLTTSACAPASHNAADAKDDAEIAANYDPLEGFNRLMHSVNKTLDGVILRPLASIYRGVMPEMLRKGVNNFLTNLNQPVVFANSVLQGDAKNAGDTFGRTLINTTLGVGGVFDLASEMGVKNRKEDFGQTLGVWGAGAGTYIEWPIIGPSNTRDSIGRLVDWVMDPISSPFNDKIGGEWKVAKAGANILNFRANEFGIINNMYDNSLDSYSTFRSYYLQNRAAEIANHKAVMSQPEK